MTGLTHVHLLLNHIPIIGVIIALGLFVFSLLGSDDLKRASLVILVGIALIAIPTYMTGYAAERGIRNLSGVSRDFTRTHNDAALLALLFMETTGLMAWLGLWQFRRMSRAANWNVMAILLLSMITVYLAAVAGNTGGEIRHPEIRAIVVPGDTGGPIAGWLNAASIGSFVTGAPWMWPTCETLHFIGLSLLLGVVFLVNLRMLGVMKNVGFPALHRLLPWAILGFGINVMTGMLFFMGMPEQYTRNPAFQWKIVFVLLAGANALYFTMFDDAWVLAAGDDAPLRAKVVAVSAAFLWIGIMWFGNMLPFIGNSF